MAETLPICVPTADMFRFICSSVGVSPIRVSVLHPLVSAIAFWYVCMSAADALRFCCADSGHVPLVFAVLQRARPAFCVLAIRWRCMQKKRMMCSAEKRIIFSKGGPRVQTFTIESCSKTLQRNNLSWQCKNALKSVTFPPCCT